jgi:tol-pal system protein YbgF
MVIPLNLLFLLLFFLPHTLKAITIESLPLDENEFSHSLDHPSSTMQLLQKKEELLEQNFSLQRSIQLLEEKMERLDQNTQLLQENIESFGQHQREFMGYITQTLLDKEKKQDNTEIQKAYNIGLELMKQNKIQAALAHWQYFLEQYQNVEQTPYAYYWVAEIYYLLQEDDLAKDSYLFLVKNYPNFEKKPDALYKIAQILYNFGSSDQAQQYWQEIIDSYPKSTAAALSKQQLTDRARL